MNVQMNEFGLRRSFRRVRKNFIVSHTFLPFDFGRVYIKFEYLSM